MNYIVNDKSLTLEEMEVGKQMVDIGTPEFVCISVQTVDFVVTICKSHHMLYIQCKFSFVSVQMVDIPVYITN